MVIDDDLRSPSTAEPACLELLIDVGIDGEQLRVSGDLDHETARIFTGVLDGLVAGGHIDVRLDVAGLTFFDVPGFTAVCDGYRRVGELGGRLRVINADRLFHTVAAWWGVPELCDDGGPAPLRGR